MEEGKSMRSRLAQGGQIILKSAVPLAAHVFLWATYPAAAVIVGGGMLVVILAYLLG